jgi:hypothetical protein
MRDTTPSLYINEVTLAESIEAISLKYWTFLCLLLFWKDNKDKQRIWFLYCYDLITSIVN